MGQVNAGFIQVLYLGRAPRTKETLPDFLKWRRVTRPLLVFRGLTGSQRTPRFWSVTINEKELLAIIKGINKFEIFLLPKPFIIETDNTQVAGFIKNNTGKGVQVIRLSRWQTLFSYYNFKIVHIKGTDNFLADFLSRNVE